MIPQSTSADRTKETAHYVIARAQPDKLGATKLNKSMFVADVRAWLKLGKTITGQSSYRKLQHGPVPNGITKCIDQLVVEGKIATRNVTTFAGERREFLWLEEPPVGEFSAEEIDILNQSIDWVCNNHTAVSISEWTHDALWEETEMGAQISLAAASVVPRAAGPEQLKWALAARYE